MSLSVTRRSIVVAVPLLIVASAGILGSLVGSRVPAHLRATQVSRRARSCLPILAGWGGTTWRC